MKINRIILTLCFVAVSFATVNAQLVKGAEAQTKRGPYETNGFFDNVFIGVAGGFNYYQGENDSYLDLKDRLAPAVNAYIGKWFTPSVGLRIGYYGFRAKGFTIDQSNPFIDENKDHGYLQRFNINNVRADLMWNLSNAIGGYRADRFYSFAPYFGTGVAWSGSKHKVAGSHHRRTELAHTLGLYNMFRVCNGLNVTLDISQTYVNERFDNEVADSRKEFIGTIALGLAYSFKNREFSRAHGAVDVTPYTSKIKDLEAALRDANNRPAKEVIKEVIVEKEKNVLHPTPVALFFPIGRSTLDATQLMNLDFYVKNAIQADPNHVFTLTGSADSATGTTKINDRLGEKRVQVVYDLLVQKYGINPDRLVKKSIGGTDKYGVDRLNRCVVIE